VQHPADLPVAGPRQPVPDLITGGGAGGRGAIPGGEVRPGREPGHVPDLGQQPGSTGRADPVQVRQGGGGGGEQRIEFFEFLLAAFLRWQMRSRSPISPAATRRRALPAASRGRTVASSALAWAADRLFLARRG
jgi:hypothetical protein